MYVNGFVSLLCQELLSLQASHAIHAHTDAKQSAAFALIRAAPTTVGGETKKKKEKRSGSTPTTFAAAQVLITDTLATHAAALAQH